MNKEKLIGKLLAATPAELNRVAAVLAGETPTEPTDRRLLTVQQAADALGISRTTCWRLLRDGRLPFVELRPGSRRVPSQAVTEFARRGATAVGASRRKRSRSLQNGGRRNENQDHTGDKGPHN